jgi:polar amino acid transport system substrate-binding protein
MSNNVVKNMKIIIFALAIMLFSHIEVNAIDTVLKVAVNPNLPPYQFIDNTKLVGMHIDIMNELAVRYGFIIEYINIEDTSKCLEALEKGEVNIVLGVMINDNVKYKAGLTENISHSTICMITNNSKIESMQNKINKLTTTYEDNTVSYSFIHNMKNLKTIVVSDQKRAFNMLASKKAEALIGVKDSILYQMEKANLEDEYTILNNYMGSIEYVMAVNSGDVNLQKKINNGLQQLRISGKYEEIHDKWVNEDKYIIRKLIEKIIYFAVIILSAIAVILIFNLRLNVLLKRQVNEKTKELQKTNKALEDQIIETRNNNELKNRIVENSPSSIIVFDIEYKITLFNQSACKLIGITELSIGQSVFSIELLKNLLYDKKDRLFLYDSKILNEEITLRNGDDQNICYRYDIYQLFDPSNNVRGAILAIEDITREIAIKEQTYEREKNKALNQIIAGIAHEIRNPLTTIKTYIELIPVKRDNVKFQSQLTELVPKEVDRVSNLIKNLIDYAKPENSNMEVIAVKELIESSTALICHVLENEKIDLNIDIENGLNIKADKNQLKQVLLNIILNGFESMKNKISNNSEIKEKLKMHIKAWKSKGVIFIQVIDEGIGMTEYEIKKSIEPFFTTKASGTGLGLYISKQYIEKNGGTIQIESKKSLYTKILLRFEG